MEINLLMILVRENADGSITYEYLFYFYIIIIIIP